MKKIEKKFWDYVDKKINGESININLYNSNEKEAIKKVAADNRISFLLEKNFFEPSFTEVLLRRANEIKYESTLYSINDILKRFDLTGIEYVIYKGGINNLILYNSFVRDFTDVDLIIKKKDFQKVWNILYENGYKERDDDGLEPDIYNFKYLMGGAQFTKSNNSYVLTLDIHTNAPIINALADEILLSRIDYSFNFLNFKIPNRTYYFLIMLINLYDNFCTTYGILHNYRFIDIYECILFYKKFEGEIDLNIIIHTFYTNKRSDIVTFVFYILNLFSPNLFGKNPLLREMLSDEKILSKIGEDSNVLILNVKECMFSKTKRIVIYNNSIRDKKPNYIFPDNSCPPFVIKHLKSNDFAFNWRKRYSALSTPNNKDNTMLHYNIFQSKEHFVVVFKDLLNLNNHIVELCLFDDDKNSETLNKMFTFKILLGEVEQNICPIKVYCSKDDVAFFIPFSLFNIYENKYIFFSFLIRKMISKKLSLVVLGSGWYTSPVKYYIN